MRSREEIAAVAGRAYNNRVAIQTVCSNGGIIGTSRRSTRRLSIGVDIIGSKTASLSIRAALTERPPTAFPKGGVKHSAVERSRWATELLPRWFLCSTTLLLAGCGETSGVWGGSWVRVYVMGSLRSRTLKQDGRSDARCRLPLWVS